MDHVDVNDMSELPPPPPGYVWDEFLGGEKQLRCYLVPVEMPRVAFIRDHEDLLDETLRPIYASDAMRVGQDCSNALPGFYVVGFPRHFRSIDEMDEITYLRSHLVLRSVRQAMREVLGLRVLHMHCEEKLEESSHVHYWLMPLRYDVSRPAARMTKLDINHYLGQFRFTEQRENILVANKLMRERLAELLVAERERDLVRMLESRP